MYIIPILGVEPFSVMVRKLSDKRENSVAEVSFRDFFIQILDKFRSGFTMLNMVYIVISIRIFVTVEMEFEFLIISVNPFSLNGVNSHD